MRAEGYLIEITVGTETGYTMLSNADRFGIYPTASDDCSLVIVSTVLW